jgi:hypothetical protein
MFEHEGIKQCRPLIHIDILEMPGAFRRSFESAEEDVEGNGVKNLRGARPFPKTFCHAKWDNDIIILPLSLMVIFIIL